MKKLIVLKELPSLKCFKLYSCSRSEVVKVETALEMTSGKKKQDMIVGDSTGTARVTIWEEEIGKMEEGDSVKMTGMMVREFQGKKYLSTSKEKSKLQKSR